MNHHDYVVTVDEHGEPVISHALFGLGKGGQKKDHKYYTRVQDKNRWRYFYSPEEFRAWQTGGSKKKVSTSDKMKSAFKQLKETGKKAVNTAADKLGVDERQAAKEAWSKVPKHINSTDKKAMQAWQKAEKASGEYYKTPLGKAESAKDRIEEEARDLALDVKDKLKSKSDRMKEEFRKKAKETAETVKDKAKSKIDEVTDTYQHNKEAIAKAEELDKAEAERESAKAKRPATRQKPEATGSAKEGSLTRHTAEKSKYSEYTKGDSDFDDDNYQEENRVGDTDFFIHKRKDGTNVILEEDMKWVLPKGVDGKSPEIQKAIQDFASHVESARKLGENYTGDQWTNEVTKAIDDAVRKTPISSSKSDSSKKEEPYVSDEYKQAVEFNSKKNNYFGRSGDSSEQSTFSPKTTTKMTVDPRKVSSEYMLTAAYNSGIDISKLQSADNKHAKAQRAYNQALNNPNTSSQEKDRLFRELTKAEKAYYDEADKIADELNKK